MRWAETSDGLAKILTNVTGDVLIASAVVSYLGPFTQAFRDRVVARWIALCKAEALPCSEKFSLTATLGDAVTTRPQPLALTPTANPNRSSNPNPQDPP